MWESSGFKPHKGQIRFFCAECILCVCLGFFQVLQFSNAVLDQGFSLGSEIGPLVQDCELPTAPKQTSWGKCRDKNSPNRSITCNFRLQKFHNKKVRLGSGPALFMMPPVEGFFYCLYQRYRSTILRSYTALYKISVSCILTHTFFVWMMLDRVNEPEKRYKNERVKGICTFFWTKMYRSYKWRKRDTQRKSNHLRFPLWHFAWINFDSISFSFPSCCLYLGVVANRG